MTGGNWGGPHLGDSGDSGETALRRSAVGWVESCRKDTRLSVLHSHKMNFLSRSDAFDLCEEWEYGPCPIQGLVVHSVDSLEGDFGQLILDCTVGTQRMTLRVNLAEDLFVLVDDDKRLKAFFKGRRLGMRGALVPASARSVRRMKRSPDKFVSLLESAVFAIQVATS